MNTEGKLFQAVVDLQVLVQPLLEGDLKARAIHIDGMFPDEYQVEIFQKGVFLTRTIGYLCFLNGMVVAKFVPKTTSEEKAHIMDLLSQLNSFNIMHKLDKLASKG